MATTMAASVTLSEAPAIDRPAAAPSSRPFGRRFKGEGQPQGARGPIGRRDQATCSVVCGCPGRPSPGHHRNNEHSKPEMIWAMPIAFWGARSELMGRAFSRRRDDDDARQADQPADEERDRRLVPLWGEQDEDGRRDGTELAATARLWAELSERGQHAPSPYRSATTTAISRQHYRALLGPSRSTDARSASQGVRGTGRRLMMTSQVLDGLAPTAAVFMGVAARLAGVTRRPGPAAPVA